MKCTVLFCWFRTLVNFSVPAPTIRYTYFGLLRVLGSNPGPSPVGLICSCIFKLHCKLLQANFWGVCRFHPFVVRIVSCRPPMHSTKLVNRRNGPITDDKRQLCHFMAAMCPLIVTAQNSKHRNLSSIPTKLLESNNQQKQLHRSLARISQLQFGYDSANRLIQRPT